MQIYLGTDHAGFTHKEVVKQSLLDAGYTVTDCGAYAHDPNDDYPDFIIPAVSRLGQSPEARAIIFGGSGQGEAMLANHFPGVRAVVYYGGPTDIVTLSREHNDANVLSLGARFMSEAEAETAVKTWLSTPFSAAPRHVRRLKAFPKHR